MPLGRYFVFTGSLLLALLLLADWYMPPLAATPAKADVDRTIIRLHSLHKWPERIVIDTSLPTIVPPPVAVAEAPPLKSTPAVRPAREAFALAAPVQAAAPAITPRLAPKRRTRTARPGGYVASVDAYGYRDVFPPGW
jgi:Zn-dependent protease with chaperone function